MKKTIVISAIALCFSLGSINAIPLSANQHEINFTKSNHVNAFCKAIAKGDYVTVKKLIDLGESVNKTSNGLTPVMYAARFNRVKILKLLIEKGANLKSKSAVGLTAKKYAELSNANDALAVLNKALTRKKK